MLKLIGRNRFGERGEVSSFGKRGGGCRVGSDPFGVTWFVGKGTRGDEESVGTLRDGGIVLVRGAESCTFGLLARGPVCTAIFLLSVDLGRQSFGGVGGGIVAFRFKVGFTDDEVEGSPAGAVAGRSGAVPGFDVASAFERENSLGEELILVDTAPFLSI